MQNNLALFKLTNLTIFLIFLHLPFTVFSTFTITNNCPFTIWPGTLSGAGTPPLSTTGFRLDSGKSVRLDAVPGWSGRIWARTGCQFDGTGAGKCLTGDCGGRLECDGSGATPPASLFEITLGQGNDKDFYDVSIVDGYNLPIIAWPTGAIGAACNATGCISDINMGCPKELQVMGGEEGGVIACKSACEAFGQEQYCCSGQFANPTTCKPTYYSNIFKRACPRAYSYAFDDGTSTFTCKAYNYAIVFCPSTAAMKKNPSDGTAMSPPSVPYNSPPSFPHSSPPVSYGTPPSFTYNSPPSFTYNSPPSNTYGSPPSFTYNSPPSNTYDSPPSFTYNSPPSNTYSPQPSFTNDSPPNNYGTVPSFLNDSPPPIRKHSYGASEGEVSSSYTLLPYPAYILLTFSFLLWN